MADEEKILKLVNAIRVALADAARDLMASGYFRGYTVAFRPDPSGPRLVVRVQGRDLAVYIEVEFSDEEATITDHRVKVVTDKAVIFGRDVLCEARDAMDMFEIALEDALSSNRK